MEQQPPEPQEHGQQPQQPQPSAPEARVKTSVPGAAGWLLFAACLLLPVAAAVAVAHVDLSAYEQAVEGAEETLKELAARNESLLQDIRELHETARLQLSKARAKVAVVEAASAIALVEPQAARPLRAALPLLEFGSIKPLRLTGSADVPDRLLPAPGAVVSGMLVAGLVVWILSFSVLVIWTRAMVSVPVRRLSGAMERLLSEQDPRPHLLERRGWFPFAFALQRIQGRLEQGRRTELELEDVRKDVDLLRQWLEGLAGGSLASPPELTSQMAAELGRAAEKLEQKLQQAASGLVAAAARLQMQSEQLATVAGKLEKDAEVEPFRAADYTAAADLLEVQLPRLADELGRLSELFDTAPRGPEAGGECPLATLGDGELSLDILGLDDFQERMKQLAQKARLLATQVAIAAEGGRGGLSSVDTDCRLLAQELEQASESFPERAEGLSRFFRSLGRQAAGCSQSLESMRHGLSACRELVDRASALLGRLSERTDALVATGSGLGSSYRELAGEFHKRQQWTERIREQLASVGRASAATAEAAGAVASMVADTFGEKVPAAASVARQLLQSHRALRNAVEQLAELAETNRIDLVTPEAEAVLESIHRAADAARRSIAGDAEKG